MGIWEGAPHEKSKAGFPVDLCHSLIITSPKVIIFILPKRELPMEALVNINKSNKYGKAFGRYGWQCLTLTAASVGQKALSLAGLGVGGRPNTNKFTLLCFCAFHSVFIAQMCSSQSHSQSQWPPRVQNLRNRNTITN